MTDTTTATTGEIVTSTPRAFSVEELRSINSFDDALNLTVAKFGTEIPQASEEIGDGFTLLDKEEKDILIRRDMILLDWSFSKGDFGSDFVTIRCVTRDGGRYIVNDGGTGICEQLREYSERTGRYSALRVERGLRKSEYSNEYSENAVTYYLDTSSAR